MHLQPRQSITTDAKDSGSSGYSCRERRSERRSDTAGDSTITNGYRCRDSSVLASELERLPELLEPIRQAAESVGLAEAQVGRLELAVEEALVNVCHYAYADQTEPGPVHCRIAVQPQGLLVEIADEGAPFDPLARPDPDTHSLELEQREPALGIFLIKQLVSEVSYRRDEGQNVLAIRVVR